VDIAALQLTLRRFAGELLQLADRAAIVLHDGPGAKTHVLVDWENVQPNETECRALVPDATDVWLFHGPNQKNVGTGYASFGERATAVRIARTGKNALDFHLAFYMGYIAAKHPGSRLVVLSNDKGYGPMLEHAKELGFVTSQSGFGDVKVARPPRKTPARKAAAKQASAKTKPPAPVPRKTAARKQAPARKPAVAKKAATTAAKTAPPTRTAPPTKIAPPTKTAAEKKKSFEQVLASLTKSRAANRPGKYSRLLAYIGSRVGADAKMDAQAMLDRLVAEGKITVDGKENVSYRL